MTAVSREVVIGAMKPEDAERCAELETILFAGDGPWSTEAFRAELRQPANHYFAARVNGELVGYAGIALLGTQGNGEAEVHTVGVDPAWQRHGIGRLLMEAMLEVSDAFGGPVFLEVRTDNAAAIGMYQSFEFEILGKRPNYYQPSGADAYTMCRGSADEDSL